MSITPAQLIPQAASTENSADPRTPSPPPARTSGGARSSPSASQPASPNPVNTDLRVDNQHQFYYQFVDANTGDVVFEIPPEALRAIGESLNLTPEGHTAVHNVDVKS